MMLSAFVNHLWQSTIFALAAGALTLLLRRQRAAVRYWVWLSASVKFLIPFSWLVALGNRIAWFRNPASGAASRLYMAIQVMGGVTPGGMVSGLERMIPALVAVWVIGIVVVFAAWCVNWRRMSVAVRSATLLLDGREVLALRRAERALERKSPLLTTTARNGAPMRGGAPMRPEILWRPVELRLSGVSLEPGAFGIVRPVLMWPAGISEHLDDAQLEAILAHEVEHVRRRDNLTAAMHMIIEAMFWFHPLVWWLGARLVEERERACDENVLELGSERRAYAEGILKVCEFCLASPLASMAGVAGGDLKKRMVSIMTEQRLQKLDFTRKLLLGVAGVIAVAAPIVFGILHATPSRAESFPVMAVDSQQSEPYHVSKKDMSGMLVKKVPPQYPEAAKNARIQGEVKLKATIGKTGDVEHLEVVSGPQELVPAAMDAVRQWKYRPYLINGQPTEVVTDIDVNFTLVN
jgi:bla regulator protein blaR1